MQAMILAAGFGSRLGEMTKALPKPMIPIGRDSTMLSIVLDNLTTIDVSRVVIMVGHANGAIENWVADNQPRYPFEIITEPVRDMAGSNASTLLDALTVHGSEATLVHNGDTLTSSETLHSLRRDSDRLVLAIDTDKALTVEAMKVTIADGAVRRVSKRLVPTDAQGEYIGISFIPHGLINVVADSLESLIQSERDEYYEDAFDAIAQDTDLVVPQAIPSHPWIEVDTPQDLVAARRMFAQ